MGTVGARLEREREAAQGDGRETRVGSKDGCSDGMVGR
jgi:hypothetical protein